MLTQAERPQAAIAQMEAAGTDPTSARIVAGENERITKAERRRDGIPANRLATLAGV